MRLHFIICKVLQREAYFCASRSKNVVDITLMPQGLHNTPDLLQKELKEKVGITKDIQDRPYDAILLGYGLCSNGIAGLSAEIPLVIPRGHDCMTILLGSKEKYQKYFDTHKGIYWYSPGWIEHNLMPGKQRHEETLAEYKEKYGEDNAEYLMEMEQGWMKEYNWATYIDWPNPHNKEYKKYTKESADYLKWNYDEVSGDPEYLQRLVDGDWNDDDFLIMKPGQKVAVDVSKPGIIEAQD